LDAVPVASCWNGIGLSPIRSDGGNY
jgi:hypothetical protein